MLTGVTNDREIDETFDICVTASENDDDLSVVTRAKGRSPRSRRRLFVPSESEHELRETATGC